MLIWERKREGDEQTIKKLVKTGNEWGLQSSLQDSFASQFHSNQFRLISQIWIVTNNEFLLIQNQPHKQANIEQCLVRQYLPTAITKQSTKPPHSATNLFSPINFTNIKSKTCPSSSKACHFAPITFTNSKARPFIITQFKEIITQQQDP
jgi:hypothetical protein